MSVMLGLISRDNWRYAAFGASLEGLEKPPGSEFMPYTGYSTPQGWNAIADALLKSKHEYLFTMNDDHIYPPDAITRLMSHEKDCVTGLYLLKQLPFEPVIYDVQLTNGMQHRYLRDGETGLVEIMVCGDGALLTHRSVFEKIPRPWYVLTGPPATPDQIHCDVLFCQKLRAHGFQIWCDLDVQVGHIASVPIFPKYENGKWMTALVQSNGQAIGLSAAKPGEREALAEDKRRQDLAAEGMTLRDVKSDIPEVAQEC